MNIYDIAEKAGVSIATISRVLNGNGKVHPRTKEKILKIIKETGFVPTKNRNTSKSRTIAIVCSSFKNPTVSENVEMLSRLIEKNNFRCMLSFCDSDIHDKRKTIERLVEHKVDAIIIDGISFLDPVSDNNSYILSPVNRTPVMVINGVINHPKAYSIICDMEDALRNLVTSYIKKGTSDILFLFNDMWSYSINLLECFKNIYSLNNVEADINYTHMCKDYTQLKEYLMKLDTMAMRPKLIICSTDLLAVYCMKYFREAGITCPNEIELISCGGSEYVNYCTPSVSSIHGRNELMCTTAVNSLIGILNNTEVPSKTILSAEFVKKESTR